MFSQIHSGFFWVPLKTECHSDNSYIETSQSKLPRLSSISVIQIAKLNIKGNKTAYYIKSEDWQSYLEEAFTQAIRPASVEVLNGNLKPKQFEKRIDKIQLLEITQQLLLLTYETEIIKLPDRIDSVLMNLPGGEDWFEN